MKLHLLTLGCSKNTADSEKIANYFCAHSWEWEQSPADADLVLVNTCGFIRDAKEESLKTIMQLVSLKEQNNSQKLAVFGCLVKRYRSEISQGIPEIDFLFEFLNEDNLQQLIQLGKAHAAPDYSKSWRFFTPQHIGILKIAEGCSNRCSYCAIPMIRGDFHSFSEDDILESAQKLADSGAIELSVVAQDITRYGTDTHGKCMLPQLINKISQIEQIRWIRLHYMHPKGLTTDLIDSLYQQSEKVVPYFDIPFQHASDRILTLMNRGCDQDHHLELINHIRTHYPQAAIRSTFIVGFPSETEEEFQELIDFIELNPLDRVGAFAYSTEESTAAKKIRGKLTKPEKQARLDQLMTLQQLIAQEQNESLNGKQLSLIVDSIDGDNAIARTQFDAFEVDNSTLIGNASHLTPGDIVEAKIIKTDAYDFQAELLP